MMERKHLHGITLLGGLAMALLCGCIRDELEPCPPLRLSLEVADKNYVNSAAAARLGYEEERPEDLPFREYVSDLAYRVSDLETGRVVAERAVTRGRRRGKRGGAPTGRPSLRLLRADSLGQPGRYRGFRQRSRFAGAASRRRGG